MVRVRLPAYAYNMEEQKEKKFGSKFGEFYDKKYKLFLVLTTVLILSSFIFLFVFHSQNNDFIHKDVSLTGGTSITINSNNLSLAKLQQDLPKVLGDAEVTSIRDVFTQQQKAIVVQTNENPDQARQVLEKYLGYSLTAQNSSFEFTNPSLGSGFYQQLLIAVLIAFSFMGVVVFFLFGKGAWIKTLLVFLALLSPFLFFAIKLISLDFALILSLITFIASLFIYWRFNVPSFAVVFSAFADILMTLIVIDILGMKISSAGIIAFLMLIGYSVDTDILLTNRVLKGTEGSTNHRIFGAFKTGITMTVIAILAVLSALVLISSFSNTMSQIFTILAIGLCFDIYNTWVTNASLIKWYVERKR